MSYLSEAPSWKLAHLLADGGYEVFKAYAKWVKENTDSLQELGSVPEHAILLVSNFVQAVVLNLVELGANQELIKVLLYNEFIKISHLVE